MVLYSLYCVSNVLIHREEPEQDLGRWTSTFSGGGSVIVQGQRHIKASKNYNNVVSEERLAHIRTIVVSLGGKLTYLFICLYGSASPKVWCDFWSVNLFCCWWLWFVVCGFVELLGHVDVFFVVYEIFGCLCLDVGHWVGMQISMAQWWEC
jgi:hypothetical protein